MRSWGGAVGVWAIAVAAAACGDGQTAVADAASSSGVSERAMDADTVDPAGADGATDAAEPAPEDAGSTAPFGFGFDASAFAFPARVCALHVGAECDGDEDCPNGEMCCGVFDSTAFTYTAIQCRSSCEQPDHFRLCHPGDECADPAHVCRPSQIIPQDFILVCFDPTDEVRETRGRSIEGEVVCGSTTCEVGQEKCCLRSWLYLADGSQTAPEPYCAPLDARCACTDQPPVGSVDAPDAGEDSGPDAGDEDAG